MIEEKGIAGFKKSEFTEATPERVFGSDVRIDDMPEGVRLYIREKAIDFSGKRLAVNVYRLVDDGGMKNKRVWCGKFNNRIPDESDIAEQFGGGAYCWICRWKAVDGGERGILSDTIEIDEERGRAAHAEWKARQSGGDSTRQPAAPAAVAPAPTLGGGFDFAGILRIMEATEEKALARMERMAAMFAGQRAETPADVLKSAYMGASEMIRSAVETNINMAKAVNKASQNNMRPPEPEGEELDPEPAGPRLPAWLDAFMPQIEKGIEKLLGGGPVGGAVKTLILSSDEWRMIFQDKEKWGEAVSAMEQHFGSDKTRRALDILLNRRESEAKKGKRK